ncbi:LacI family DNA-binding transcriptional regulator [Kineosporia sp. NBRC 101731]|uniref:LacI family DNA-binding transcriptional regulator n=1 Tax=Kineosporia sp. NBRC 101731 TaxID=3032199 RepID=UPI0024A5E580|nr:LacI family DNA-binding transcriptional regulator [Kineosporia sp. NBRC 101731]GLY33216.1 LacI family transcriptional regulator [Kineosporia sp. NBRC 101731]
MTPPSRASAPAGSDPGNSGGPGSVGQRKRPGMHDVAKLAGVSHQTVSRVLNGSDGVSSRTRAVVLAAIDQLGYRPNSAARTLVTGRSKVLGLVTIGGALYGPMSMLYGVEAAAREEGYILTVVNVGWGEGGSVERAVTRLERQGVDGIVVVAPLTSVGESLTTMARHLPLVAVESSLKSTLPVISVDQIAGARLATEHLLGLGHSTVWHVSGPGHFYEAQDRVVGWTAALEDAGAEVPPLLHGDWSAATGYDAGQILSRMRDVTAVFVANDSMAVGVLRALRENGRDLPGDISVVGFDDIPEAGYFSPPLTTVRQPFEEVGRRSLKALLAQIETGVGEPGRTVIGPELVIRESTAAPR